MILEPMRGPILGIVVFARHDRVASNASAIRACSVVVTVIIAVMRVRDCGIGTRLCGHCRDCGPEGSYRREVAEVGCEA